MRSEPARRNDVGFTLVEVLTVVLILGTLVLIAVPVFLSSRSLAEKRTCFQNQNTLARATELYLAVDVTFDRRDLSGIVNDEHPIIVQHIVGHAPRCPAGAAPVDPESPTIAEGAYQFDATGNLMGCTLGSLGPHGSFRD